MTDKLPPHEAWDRAVESHLDDEAERVGKLTDLEVDRDLANKGVDPKVIRAKGEALAAKLKAAKAAKEASSTAAAGREPALLTLPPRRWGNVVGLASAALAVAAIVFLVVRQPGPDGGPVAIPTSPPPASSLPAGPSPIELASTLRRDAYAACGIKQWDDCQQKLDEAWRLDPTGEQDPRVRSAREAAKQGLIEVEERANAKSGPK